MSEQQLAPASTTESYFNTAQPELAAKARLGGARRAVLGGQCLDRTRRLYAMLIKFEYDLEKKTRVYGVFTAAWV